MDRTEHRDNGEVCCGDCAHLEQGRCGQAPEVLRRAGWPELAVLAASRAAAGACPGFEPTENHLWSLREARARGG